MHCTVIKNYHPVPLLSVAFTTNIFKSVRIISPTGQRLLPPFYCHFHRPACGEVDRKVHGPGQHVRWSVLSNLQHCHGATAGPAKKHNQQLVTAAPKRLPECRVWTPHPNLEGTKIGGNWSNDIGWRMELVSQRSVFRAWYFLVYENALRFMPKYRVCNRKSIVEVLNVVISRIKIIDILYYFYYYRK